ncbi:transporter [Enterocytozoon bieneusi H348]|nr:transporter [Enterocytozoon bieneusi H348]|eukprot:XP_002650198.1 transporter [Enterocytozoon bieneusi H348]
MNNPNIINQFPSLRSKSYSRVNLDFENGYLREVTAEAIFELIRDIQDPEHPYTLEDLGVVSLSDIKIYTVYNNTNIKCTDGFPLKFIEVQFTPTVPHCSLVGIIGLSIAYQLYKHTRNYVIKLRITKGSHHQEEIYNKQLNDRERVFAAFENESILEIIENSINK